MGFRIGGLRPFPTAPSLELKGGGSGQEQRRVVRLLRSLPRNRGRGWEGAFRRSLLLLTIILTLLPTIAVADQQGVIPFPVEDASAGAGNPYVRGIASHAWWLDPEVYGDQLFPALDELQVTTVRLSIDWRRFEPEPGVWDWGMYDRVLGELAKRNIVVVATFNTIPGWASVDQEGCASAFTEVQTCQLREDMYDEFAAAMEAALSRYSWVHYWEFWNEPEMWPFLGREGPTYLRHLRLFYDVAHRVNPEITVAAQTLVGAEYMEYIYNLSEDQYGDGNEPWDAISIHPYNFYYVPNPDEPPLEINYDRVRWLRDLMVSRGDGDEKIWVTEFGWTNEEEYQARNLPVTLDWLQQQPYIEFAHLHMLHDWNEELPDQFGLMEIVADENGYRYLDENTQFVPKEIYYNAYKNYPTDLLGRRPTGDDVLTFPKTGHSVQGRFLEAWREWGGLETVGLPLTRPYPRQGTDGVWRLVQDFERARLEFHPEYVGQDAEVLGAAIGREMTADRQGEPGFQPLESCPPAEGLRCFDIGFSVAGDFLEFWESHDGEKLFGLPISRQFEENGLSVQYFERARLEFHPDSGTIMVGAIIREQLAAQGWLTPDASDIRLPTRREFP